jgi:serine/threonine-protein kinase
MTTADTITLSTVHGELARGEASPATVTEVTVPRQLGSVRLDKEIGRGAMGVVWLGRDSILSRDVAVKFLLNVQAGPNDSNFVRFVDGARAAAAVRHPSLVTLYHAEVAFGVPYLVMEYVDGPAISEIVRKTGPMKLSATLAVLSAIAEAIEALHTQNVVHRDVKPSNVLLDLTGKPFLADFGLACPRPTSSAAQDASALAGTPAYLAPEGFDGAITPKCDVYALGITAFEMLTGNVPFSAGSWQEIRESHQKIPLPIGHLATAGATEKIIDVIERATHKQPMFRYKSARALLRGLEEAVGPKVMAAATKSTDELAALVLTCRRAQGRVGAANQTQPQHPTSYFDRISQMAEEKKKHRPSWPGTGTEA